MIGSWESTWEVEVTMVKNTPSKKVGKMTSFKVRASTPEEAVEQAIEYGLHLSKG